MPLYDYKCPLCWNEEEHIVAYSERDMQHCTACGAPTKRTWKAGHVFVEFKPRMFNGFPSAHNRDVLVESKSQLKKLCKEHDCSSVYLMDS